MLPKQSPLGYLFACLLLAACEQSPHQPSPSALDRSAASNSTPTATSGGVAVNSTSPQPATAASGSQVVVESYQTFATELLAIRHALRRWNPHSISINREIGAQVCELDGSYFSANATISGWADHVEPTACPENTKPVASWHTHATRGQHVPSGQDFVNARDGIRRYLAVPSGRFFRYESPNRVYELR